MTIEECSISKNLNDFYLSWRGSPSIIFNENNKMFLIQNERHLWPNLVVNKVGVSSINELLNSVKTLTQKSIVSAYWLMGFDIAKENNAILRTNKFRPIESWTGMFLNKNKPFSIVENSNFKVVKVTSKKELKTWVQLVDESIFKNNKYLELQLFESSLENSNFSFFIGKLNNKEVSTVLLFNNNSTIGLYFITTKKEFRGQGFAELTIKIALNNFIKKKNTNFVLQATKEGLNLYEKLEFKENNKFVIFAKHEKLDN